MANSKSPMTEAARKRFIRSAKLFFPSVGKGKAMVTCVQMRVDKRSTMHDAQFTMLDARCTMRYLLKMKAL